MYRKKIMAMAAGLILAVGAAGCGTEKGDDTTAILQKAQGTMSKLESLSADSETKIVMKNDSETETTMIWRNQEIFMNPFKMHYKTKVMLGEGSEVVDAEEQYAEERDGMVHTYMITVGDVFADSYGAEEFIGEQALADLDLYLTKLQSAQTVGTEEINGIQTTKISGVLTGEAMEKVLETSGIDLIFGGLGWSLDELYTELKDMKELPVSLWISPDGYLICYEFDMTDRMQAALDNLSGTEENFQTIVKTKLRVTCSNFNEISDFEIPKEITSGAVEFEKSVRK